MLTVGVVPHRVVVGVDPRLPSETALLSACSIASALEATVDAVAVWDITAAMAADWVDSWDPEREAAIRLNDIVTEVLAGQSPVPVRAVVRCGRPADQLVEASRGARMLILGRGRRGRRGGLHRLLPGSVSARCVALAHCPVLIAGEDVGAGVTAAGKALQP